MGAVAGLVKVVVGLEGRETSLTVAGLVEVVAGLVKVVVGLEGRETSLTVAGLGGSKAGLEEMCTTSEKPREMEVRVESSIEGMTTGAIASEEGGCHQTPEPWGQQLKLGMSVGEAQQRWREAQSVHGEGIVGANRQEGQVYSHGVRGEGW